MDRISNKSSRLSDLLSGAVKRAGLGRQIEAAMVVEAGNRALIEHFGEGVLSHAACRSVKHDVLSISCTHSALASEIKLNQDKIIESITVHAPYSGIEDLFIVHGTRTDRGASWDTEI